MSALSERPENPPRVAVPHESAKLHVTGAALYTDDLIYRTKDVLHAHPVQVPYAHARITALRVAPALRVPGVVRVLTAADVPGVNDAGVKHDEPLFPSEVCYHGHAVCWVLAERSSGALVRKPSGPTWSRCRPRSRARRHRGELQGATPQIVRGDVGRASPAPSTGSARVRVRRQNTST